MPVRRAPGRSCLQFRRVLSFVPGKGRAHSLFKGEFGIVTEVANGSGGVGLRITYVAGARRSVFRRNFDTFDFLEESPGLIERDASAIAAVVHAAGKTGGRLRGFDVERDHV